MIASSCGQLEQAREDEKAGKKANGKSRRIFAGLIITPTVTSHVNLIGESLKTNGWQSAVSSQQSAVAQNNNNALNLLRMRTWDVVLVDEMLSSAISEFRIWERDPALIARAMSF
jgi:hypothetical protein